VVVEIKKASSPTEEWNRRSAKAGGIGDIREIKGAIVAVQGLVVVRKCSDEEIDAPIAIVVADRDSHGGLREAFVRQGKTGDVADIFKGSVMPVAIEIARNRIIRDGKVQPAVVIRSHEYRRKAVVVLRIRHACLLADVGECAIAVVVKK